MTLTGRPGRSSALPQLAAGQDRTTPSPVLLALVLLVATAVPVMRDRLQLLDVVCLVALPFVVRNVGRDRRVLLLICTAALWAVGQLLSDVVNGLGLRPSLPFACAITVFAVAPVLASLGRWDHRRMRFVIAGVAGGLVLGQLVVERYPIGDPATWKYGLSVPVSVGLLAVADLAWRRGQRLPSFLALATICGIGLWSDYRGLAGMAGLTALLVLLPRRRHRYPNLWSVLAGVSLLVGVLGAVFVESASSGVLGDRSVNQVQRYGPNPVSILVNVRPELYQELSLSWQRPLTGYGSRPHLDEAAYDRSMEFVRSVGVIRTEELREEWLHGETPGVSAHSLAADMWVRGGVSAVPFWVLAIALALRAGTAAIRFRSSPLVVLWTMLFLWDVLFSPLVATYHVQLSAYLALTLVTIADAKTYRHASMPGTRLAGVPARAPRG